MELACRFGKHKHTQSSRLTGRYRTCEQEGCDKHLNEGLVAFHCLLCDKRWAESYAGYETYHYEIFVKKVADGV